MVKEISTFGNIETEKNKFYRNKTPVFLKNGDIKKVLVSKKMSFGEKNYKSFIGYLYNDHKVKPLHIMLSKTSAYVKSYYGKFNGSFLIEDNYLLKICNTISDNVSADIKKEFDSKPVYNIFLWKPKRNLVAIKLQTFIIRKLEYKQKKLHYNQTYLERISLDSDLRKDENYYLQDFLKEC